MNAEDKKALIKETVKTAVEQLENALYNERNDFIDDQEAKKVYAEQDIIIKDLEKKYGGRSWIRECFKKEKLVIKEGISRIGVRGFVAVDENTGVIVSAFKTLESLNEDLLARADRLSSPGRTPEMRGGKRVQVYLDSEESIEIAKRLGNGNVSEGIRKALKQAAER